MKTCPACGEVNADRARFCQACATPLDLIVEPAGEVRKVVTVVFADVTGSTALGERLDPEALRRVMGRYFDEMAAVIERHGGTVEKFIGDAVMAVFGIPRLHEDDALRAVRAAVEMRSALDALNTDLQRDHGVGLAARIGVNTGEVVAGDPSSGQRLVTGDVVNVAARLEQTAGPGEILIGDATHHLVRDAVDVDPVAPLDLKGKTDAVPAFRLRSVHEDAAGHSRRLDAPLVGREKEIQLLEHALDRAISERTSHLFTLLGPAGVGKSRLVQEFLASRTGSTALRGRCLSYGEGITFFPLAEVVHLAAGINEHDDPAEARAKLDRLVGVTDDAERIVGLVAGLLGWDDSVAVEEASWGVRRLFEHLAGGAPLIVVFDDIHWAEPAFLDLVEHLADWTRDASLLLLCVARPELLEVRPGWAGGKLNATTILLEPLDADAASTLIDRLLGPSQIPAAARARILDAAEGNPLFVEEMLGMLIDDGLLRSEAGVWLAADDLADVTVPPTIQLLLAARLDRLDAEERAVIERGAIEGKVFHSGAVATMVPATLRPAVPSRLLALARKELIRPDRAEFAGEDAFRFRHLLIRDAAYQAMPKEQRADLHERFAEWLERAAGPRLPEYEEILAHHLEQAFRYRAELGPPDERTRAIGAAAAARLLRSAERARGRGEFSVARRLAARAVEIANEPDRPRALLELAIANEEAGEFTEALEAARRASAAARERGDGAIGARARVIEEGSLGQVDPGHTLATSVAGIQRSLDDLRRLGDDAGVVEATLSLARHAFFAGRCDECRRVALSLRDGAEHRPPNIRRLITINLAIPLYFGPTPAEQALDELTDMHELFRLSPFTETRLMYLRGAFLAMLDREEDSDRVFADAERLMSEIGDPAVRGNEHQLIGEAHRFLDRSERAEAAFREGREHLTELGETGFNSTMTALHALALCDLRRFDEAESAAAEARRLSAEDDIATQTAWRVAMARVWSARGEHDRALRFADEAVAINARTDYAAWIGEGHEVRGDVLAAAGRGDDARAAYEQALRRYEAKQVVRWAERVRRRIATPA